MFQTTVTVEEVKQILVDACTAAFATRVEKVVYASIISCVATYLNIYTLSKHSTVLV